MDSGGRYSGGPDPSGAYARFVIRTRTPLTASVLILAFAGLFLTVSPAFAWGPEGHAIVAEIAARYLDPDAAGELQHLLGATGLDSAANWPDRVVAALPQTAPWHYVNIPSSASGYLASRDCPQNNCVVAKIQWFSRILADRQQSPAARLVALKFLIHLVGDIHQPFHDLADARGGNDIAVTLWGKQQCGDRACDLHYVWDTALIRHTGMTRRQYEQSLERMIADAKPDAGPNDPSAWADESFHLAKEALVSSGAQIGQSYYLRERPVLDRQLALAGIRLARLLNQDLAPTGALQSNLGQFKHPTVDIAPRPVLTRLDRSHDGMVGLAKVLRSVLVFGGVAATNVAALQTESQVNPGIAGFQAFFATLGTGLNSLNLSHVGT